MYKIELTREEYTRTESGKSWRSKPDSSRVEIIQDKHYNNYIDSMKSMRRLGGSETAQRSYSAHGYNVYRLTSISPERDTKIVYLFNHDYKGE